MRPPQPMAHANWRQQQQQVRKYELSHLPQGLAAVLMVVISFWSLQTTVLAQAPITHAVAAAGCSNGDLEDPSPCSNYSSFSQLDL